jgi:CRP-like cAMP-binding protein
MRHRGELLLPGALHALPEDAQAQLRKVGYSKALRKGERLLEAGQLVNEMFFVRSGWLSFQAAGSVASLFTAGDPILTGLSRAPPRCIGDVIALTSASVAVLPRDELRTYLLRHSDVMMGLFHHVLLGVNRLRLFYARRNTDPLEVRLAYLFWTISEQTDSGERRIPGALAQAPLASLLGVPREEVSRKRNLLVKTGYLYENEGEWYLDPSTPLLLTSTGYDLVF